jgi:hypothetical protein
MSGRRREIAQAGALTRVFVARFFESEITAGRTDLTQSFFWLTAVVGAPGLLLAFYQQFAWEHIVRYGGGLAQLEVAALFDKTVYLGFTFFAVAIVAAVGWPAMLPERRDALVLGALPARPRTVIAAKLAALGAYTALLALCIHAGSALLFGLFLGSLESVASVVRTVPAHFVAAAGLTIFVMAAAAGTQSLLLLLIGPRRFHRVSALLQIAFVVTALATFVALPGRSPGASATFDETGLIGPDWVQRLPPMWFLGVYEVMAGSPFDQMASLARSAGAGLAAAIGLTIVAYPLAGRRVLASAVEAAPSEGPRTSGRAVDMLTRRLGRTPGDRATIQFALATLTRVPAHRLLLALAGALGAMGLFPLLMAVHDARAMTVSATVGVLALPFVALYFWVIGLRSAMEVPGELSGRWLFESSPVPPLAGRRAARRIMIAAGVVPVAAFTLVVWLLLWPPETGLVRAAAATAAGLLLVELLLWGYAGLPCARPLISGDLKMRTAAFLVGFEVFCFESPSAHLSWSANWSAVAIQGALFLLAALTVRLASARAAAENARMDPDADGRLELQIAFQRASGTRDARGPSGAA